MSKSYATLRAEIQQRDRSLREKVMSLDEAMNLVSDGDHVALGGCTTSRTPFAAVWGLVRARKKNLTVSRSITSTEGDILLASGTARRFVTSWFSQGIAWGVSKVMRAYVESNRAEFEEWSHMAIGLRYRAGAMGVPFLPMRSMLGSDVASRLSELKSIACPFTGEPLLLVPALNPDVALIHVHRCDAYGNAQIDGLQFMDLDIPMAATRVILTTERIVSNDQIRRAPDRTKIPFLAVDAVVEAPFGCVPHECYGEYEPLYERMDDFARLTQQQPETGAAKYLEEFYYSPDTWEDYLELIGARSIWAAARRGEALHAV